MSRLGAAFKYRVGLRYGAPGCGCRNTNVKVSMHARCRRGASVRSGLRLNGSSQGAVLLGSKLTYLPASKKRWASLRLWITFIGGRHSITRRP